MGAKSIRLTIMIFLNLKMAVIGRFILRFFSLVVIFTDKLEYLLISSMSWRSESWLFSIDIILLNIKLKIIFILPGSVCNY